MATDHSDDSPSSPEPRAEPTDRLTQDPTGSPIMSWPTNVKKAGGSLVLSTAAGAANVVALGWDGSFWIEVSRSMRVS